MSELKIEIPTRFSSMAEARPVLDTALHEQFPGGMLQRSWDGDVLHLTGPGAKGTVVFENGALVGRADLKPPASMMKPVIEKKIRSAFEKLTA
ncbi:MAG: polyhydroxyalkanoic acid system family protein [Acidobacteriota bacterium]